MRSLVRKKRGQVWIETVIYTLIGLAIIGLVMAAALPKINQKKDAVAVEQSIAALQGIDDKIYEVQRAPGNKRVVDLQIKKGSLVIDMERNKISWILDSSFPYSEEDTIVPLGRINVLTTSGNPWRINLSMDYSMDLTFDGSNLGTKQLDPAPTPYKLIIENVKQDIDGNIVIDMSENS